MITMRIFHLFFTAEAHFFLQLYKKTLPVKSLQIGFVSSVYFSGADMSNAADERAVIFLLPIVMPRHRGFPAAVCTNSFPGSRCC